MYRNDKKDEDLVATPDTLEEIINKDLERLFNKDKEEKNEENDKK